MISEAAMDHKNRTAAGLRLIFLKDERVAAHVRRLIHASLDSDGAPNIHPNFDAPKELSAKVG